MTTGTLLDLNASEGPGPAGPRPFLTRVHMIALRVLLVPYALAFILIGAANYRPVLNAVFRLSSEHFWVGFTVSFLVVIAVLMFIALLWMSLHHFWHGHVGPRPATGWIWVILLLNVAGVALYYLRIIEPEQRTLLDAARAA